MPCWRKPDGSWSCQCQTAIQSLVSPNAAVVQSTSGQQRNKEEVSVGVPQQGIGDGWDFPSKEDAEELGRYLCLPSSSVPKSLAHPAPACNCWSAYAKTSPAEGLGALMEYDQK